MASYFIDHNMSPRVVDLLRDRGQEAATARDLGLSAVHDGCILMACAKAHRIIVTQDYGDFWELHQSWQLWTRAWGVTPGAMPLLTLNDMSPFPLRHAGILTVPQAPRELRPQLVAALIAFAASGVEIENELYRLDFSRGWQHWPYVLQRPEFLRTTSDA